MQATAFHSYIMSRTEWQWRTRTGAKGEGQWALVSTESGSLPLLTQEGTPESSARALPFTSWGCCDVTMSCWKASCPLICPPGQVQAVLKDSQGQAVMYIGRAAEESEALGCTPGPTMLCCVLIVLSHN